MNKRTVYYDDPALVGQSVPVNGEAEAGYVLEPGFHMPPLMLTPDENEAVTLGVIRVHKTTVFKGPLREILQSSPA